MIWVGLGGKKGEMLWFKNISVHLCFYCQNNAFGLRRGSWMRCTLHLALLLKHFLCFILFLCHCCRLWPVCCFGAEIIEGEARMLERHSLRLHACKSLFFFSLGLKKTIFTILFLYKQLRSSSDCWNVNHSVRTNFPPFFFCSSSKPQTSRCCCRLWSQILFPDFADSRSLSPSLCSVANKANESPNILL